MPKSAIGSFYGQKPMTGNFFKNASQQVTIYKGYVVSVDTSNDDCIVPAPGGSGSPIGIAYEDIAPGESGFIITGGVVQGYIDNSNNLPVERGWWVGVSGQNPGQMTAQAAVPQDTTGHCGHIVHGRDGTPGLATMILHFN